MKENKYYTPSIEEFHVGFEFEYLAEDDTWDQCTYNPLRAKEDEDDYVITLGIIKQLIQYENGKNIRVKYLDREDIESLGWVFQSKSIDEWFYWPEKIRLESGHYMNFRLHTGYHDHKLIIFAQEYENANEETFFEGYIRNKSELKILMKWLNIS